MSVCHSSCSWFVLKKRLIDVCCLPSLSNDSVLTFDGRLSLRDRDELDDDDDDDDDDIVWILRPGFDDENTVWCWYLTTAEMLMSSVRGRTAERVSGKK